MPQVNSEIFCNTPWYELHIYWDGSLGICCQENHKLYQADQTQYNIANMTIQQWFNSEPVANFRKQILDNRPVSACVRCYREEQVGGVSRRIRSLQKSAIWMQAFEPSFEQSPGRKHWQMSGQTSTQPIDIHVDLGNFCNLACKMCKPRASSRIASQMVKWGDKTAQKYVGTDWTKDPEVWHSFKHQLLDIAGLNNIHFMGGETLLTPRFEDLVDFLIQHQRFDICLSFVTNGTVYNPTLIEKLTKFRRVGIEISIETVDEHNAYQRQGTDTAVVLEHVKKYQSHGSPIEVCLRPAVSALTIGYYPGLIEYAYNNKLLIKSLLVNDPDFLDAKHLPYSVRQSYLNNYEKLKFAQSQDYNAMDVSNIESNLADEVKMCVNILTQPETSQCWSLQQQLVSWCHRWDSVYNYDARKLYPELETVWTKYGY